MFPFITKENFCKKVLISKGISVARFISCEGMLKKILGYYIDQYQDFNIAKNAENFLRSLGEMPMGFSLIKYLGENDAGVLDAIQNVFTMADVVDFINEVIVCEKNILNLGKLYSKLVDSSIKNVITPHKYKTIMGKIDSTIEVLISSILYESGTEELKREEKMFHYLTAELHFDFYFDYLEGVKHSYDFVKKVIGEELALQAFREMLFIKKRTIKNQDWSWRRLYHNQKEAIETVISWMGDSRNNLSKDDEQLKRLFFDIIISSNAAW